MNSFLQISRCEKSTKALFKPIERELSRRENSLIAESLQFEVEDAKKANALGYMSRILIQTTLPHSDPKVQLGQLYTRDSGLLTLTVAPTSIKHGIPYGRVPRIILAWICSEVKIKKKRVLDLGKNQKEFLEKLQMHNTGRDIEQLHEQSLRLFKSVISVEYTDAAGGDVSSRMLITKNSKVFWHPTSDDKRGPWNSTLELTENFFSEILESSVPLNLRNYHALSKSPFAMDIYAWLPYRVFLLRRSGRQYVDIPWLGLKAQFGAGYPDTQQGLYSFKSNFMTHLRAVLAIYTDARYAIDVDKKFFRIKVCPLHIAKKVSTG